MCDAVMQQHMDAARGVLMVAFTQGSLVEGGKLKQYVLERFPQAHILDDSRIELAAAEAQAFQGLYQSHQLYRPMQLGR